MNTFRAVDPNMPDWASIPINFPEDWDATAVKAFIVGGTMCDLGIEMPFLSPQESLDEALEVCDTIEVVQA